MPDRTLTIGQMASRAGVPISTLHFYERRGLISSLRDGANRRVYPRETLRRVAVIKVAQRAGITLAEIEAALAHLPTSRAPDTADWERLSAIWYADLSARIDTLTALRDKLKLCIGCGCLSVARCSLANPDDRLGEEGPGARYIP